MPETTALFLTTTQVAEQLGVSIDTVRRWCLHGCRGRRLRHQRIGDRLRIPEKAVIEFVGQGEGEAEVATTLRDEMDAMRRKKAVKEKYGI